MVEAGVWLTATAIVVLALLTVASIRFMTDVLAEGEHAGEGHEPAPDAGQTPTEADPEDETPAVDGGHSGEA